MKLLGFDLETHLMGPQLLAPPIVVASFYEPGEGTILVKPDDLKELTPELLSLDAPHIVGQNLCFDFACLVKAWPEFLPAVFEKIEAGQTHSCDIRQKLLNLASYGTLKHAPYMPGQTKYHLSDLEKLHLGIDRSDEKNDENSWRLNYRELEDIPLGSWPQKAVDYCKEDARNPVAIWKLQQEAADAFEADLGINPFEQQWLRELGAFCFFLVSGHGIKIDKPLVPVLSAQMQDVYDTNNVALVRSGCLRPAVPPQPHKRNRDHIEGCPKKKCACPKKMTQAKEESYNTKKLREHIRDLSEEQGFELIITEMSGKYPIREGYPQGGQISYGKEFLKEHGHKSPILKEFVERRRVEKIISTEIPRMCWPKGSGIPADYVHPCYSILVRSGRTASFSSDTYPSLNGQNVDPRARKCFIPRTWDEMLTTWDYLVDALWAEVEKELRYLLYSCDYSQIELCTLAQCCLNFFGYSVLADKINAGIDTHAYLGAQLALHLDRSFDRACLDADIDTSSKDDVYEAFLCYKHSEEEEDREFFKHFRKFAKPTGLGYPGGLGADTFVTFAASTYDVIVDVETAKVMKQIWLETYPEMKEYFSYITKHFVDTQHSTSGRQGERYYVKSPLGLYRADCFYCSAMNGWGLQTPAADGELLAVTEIVRAERDHSISSPLSDDKFGPRHRLQLLVHDELIGEVREDVAHEVLLEVDRIMRDCMKVICPDMTLKTETALMERWDKRAEPAYDADGKLTVWRPLKDDMSKDSNLSTINMPQNIHPEPS